MIIPDMEREFTKNFGRAIKILRKEAGLTQEDLASLADINRTYLGDIERGARNIALKNIYKLAKALKIRVNKIFETIESLTNEHNSFERCDNRNKKGN